MIPVECVASEGGGDRSSWGPVERGLILTTMSGSCEGVLTTHRSWGLQEAQTMRNKLGTQGDFRGLLHSDDEESPEGTESQSLGKGDSGNWN